MKLVKTVITMALVITTASAFAGDHAAEYKVGILAGTGVTNDGTFSNGQGRGIVTKTVGHNIHEVRVDGGSYTIEAPAAVGRTILAASLTHEAMPTLHKQWFMDQLHEGDKVLFAAHCDKHNNCTIWVLNPDKENKEFKTIGSFRPDDAKTNTTQLCGKGKLSPAVEAEVCSAKN